MRRKLQGRVISDKMDKTIVVAVDRFVTHPLYKKKYRVTKKYHVRDENNKYKIGQQVTIVETKPISKTVRWQVQDDTTPNKIKSRR